MAKRPRAGAEKTRASPHVRQTLILKRSRLRCRKLRTTMGHILTAEREGGVPESSAATRQRRKTLGPDGILRPIPLPERRRLLGGNGTSPAGQICSACHGGGAIYATPFDVPLPPAEALSPPDDTGGFRMRPCGRPSIPLFLPSPEEHWPMAPHTHFSGSRWVLISFPPKTRAVEPVLE